MGTHGRILLVEDHRDTLVVLAKILRMHGHEVATASTKAEALQRCQNEDFDILLGDIQLPDGSGLDLLREAKAFSRIKGIAITACGYDADVANSRIAGYEAHLIKPVEVDVLIRTIEETLEAVTL
jgi:CheY-like chemotaxis protein